MCTYRLFLIASAGLLTFVLPQASFAEGAGTTKNNYITLSYENDLIGSGADKNYTSGVQFNYFNVNRKPPAYMRRIADSWLGYDVGNKTATYYTFGQKIFTPQDITDPNPQPSKRPWAGWLYGSVGLVNVVGNQVDQFGFTVGVVGPPSLAEHTQKFIHKNITGSDVPRGWNNQLHTEAGLILSWDRRWPQYFSEDIGGYRLAFEPNISAAAGNISTFAGVGGTLTFGPNQKQLQDTPMRVPPAMSGTGYFSTPKDKNWDWYLFTGINGRFVLRDIFLDGNSFRDSASVDKKHIVADANSGLALTYGATRVAYTIVYRTREFYGQDDPSVFGSLSLTYSF